MAGEQTQGIRIGERRKSVDPQRARRIVAHAEIADQSHLFSLYLAFAIKVAAVFTQPASRCCPLAKFNTLLPVDCYA